MNKTITHFLGILLFLALLAGCNAAPTTAPTLVPTIANPPAATAAGYPQPGSYPPPQPTVDPAQGYPLPAAPTVDPNQAYPQPGGPAGAPAVENRSLVTAKLVEKAAGDQAGQVKLTVLIQTSTEVAGMPSQTQNLVGQQVVLVADAAGADALQPGDVFQAEVSLKGDERGQVYTAAQIEKQ